RIFSERAEFARAEQEYLQAISLEPGNALAHHWYAMLLATVRRGTEAHREIVRARQLHPLSTAIVNTMGAIRMMIGWNVGGTFPPPKGFVRTTDPTNPWSLRNNANRLAAQQKCSEAWPVMQQARDIAPDNIRLEISVMELYATCGDTARARVHLARMERRPDARANGLYIAMAFGARHQLDSAFAWLAGVEWNSDMRFTFQTQPSLAALRMDPRAISVLRRMGIVSK